MLDLLRRVAVLAVVGTVGIGLLNPLTARSAAPDTVETLRLLAAADAAAGADGPGLARGSGLDRARSSALTLASVVSAIGPEEVDLAVPLPSGPATIPLEATLYTVAARSVAPPPINGDEITGRATWYCCSLGWRGLAVVALPGALGGHYDSPPAARYVTVCADRCATLPVVDYCGCYWGTASQRVADLSPEAWAAVSDSALSRGVITVTVHLDG